MPRVNAPLLSFGASGQIAKTQVYAKWKGRPYVRRYAIPSNPNTTAQQEVRSVFSFLNALWRYYPDAARGGWALAAQARQYTDRNAFLKANLAPLQPATDLTDLIMSTAALSGLAPAAFTPTPGAGSVTVVLTAPALPTGWTILAGNAMAIKNQDPHSGTDYTCVFGTDASAPYSITLSGLEATTEYLVGGWFTFMRDDGKTAYGISLQDLVTTS